MNLILIYIKHNNVILMARPNDVISKMIYLGYTKWYTCFTYFRPSWDILLVIIYVNSIIEWIVLAIKKIKSIMIYLSDLSCICREAIVFLYRKDCQFLHKILLKCSCLKVRSSNIAYLILIMLFVIYNLS